MSLNIKDPEALRLVHAISLVTGKDMTLVVIEALRERYLTIERQNGKANVDELLSIADQAEADMKRAYINDADHRYDENGLRALGERPLSPARILFEVRHLGLQTSSEATRIVRTDRDSR